MVAPSVGQLQTQGTGNSFHEIHQWNSLNFTSWSSYCSPLVSGVLGLRESWLILSISFFTRANGLVMMAMMIIIYYYRVCVIPTIVSFFWNIPKGVSWIYEQVFIGFLRLELSRSIQPHFFMICSQGPFLMTMSSFHISAIRIFATWPSKKCLLAWVPGPCFEDHLLHLSKKMSCGCTIPFEGASKLHCRGTVESCYATVAYGIYLFLTCSPDDRAITRHSSSAFSVTPTASEAR